MAEQELPNRGDIIIADPYLLGPVFERSVILMADHSDEGSMGFILNQPTSVNVHEAISEIKPKNFPLYYGGPVDQAILFYVHTVGYKISQSIPIANGLYWGGEFNELKELINNGEIAPSQIRFFVGYSGWSEGQLAQEFEKASWITTNFQMSYLFNNAPKSLWNRILKSSDSEFAFMANFPHSPSLN